MPMIPKLELQLKTLLRSKQVKILDVKDLYSSKLQEFTKKFPGRIVYGYTANLQHTGIPSPNSTKNIDKSKTMENKFNELTPKPQKDAFVKGIQIPLTTVPLSQTGVVHKVYYVAASVGRSIFSQHTQLKTLPTGFQSFITPTFINGQKPDQNKIETDKVVKESSDTSQFSYIVDSSRVLTLTEIEFEYDPLKKNFDGLCDKCTKKEAIMFCHAEQAHFCGPCDTQIHSSAFFERHTRVYFNEAEDDTSIMFLNCEIHAEKVCEWFCKDCLIPLCVACRMRGSHSATNIKIADHRIISYIEASKNYDINFESIFEREKDLTTNLSNISSELQAFETNISKLREKIDSEYKSAINELKTFTNKHYRIFNGAYLQFLHKQDHIANMRVITEKMNNAEVISNFKYIISDLSSFKIDVDSPERYTEIDVQGSLRLYKIDKDKTRYQKELQRGLEFPQLLPNERKRINNEASISEFGDLNSDLRSFMSSDRTGRYSVRSSIIGSVNGSGLNDLRSNRNNRGRG